MPRPTKFDPTHTRVIVAAILIGARRPVVVDALGISGRTLESWLARNPDREEEKGRGPRRVSPIPGESRWCRDGAP